MLAPFFSSSPQLRAISSALAGQSLRSTANSTNGAPCVEILSLTASIRRPKDATFLESDFSRSPEEGQLASGEYNEIDCICVRRLVVQIAKASTGHSNTSTLELGTTSFLRLQGFGEGPRREPIWWKSVSIHLFQLQEIKEPSDFTNVRSVPNSSTPSSRVGPQLLLNQQSFFCTNSTFLEDFGSGNKLQCAKHAAHCLLPVAHCTPPAPCPSFPFSTLPAACCVLHVRHCVLQAAGRLLCLCV